MTHIDQRQSLKSIRLVATRDMELGGVNYKRGEVVDVSGMYEHKVAQLIDHRRLAVADAPDAPQTPGNPAVPPDGALDQTGMADSPSADSGVK